MPLRVALGNHGQELARTRLGEAKRKSHNPFDAGPRHERYVSGDFDRKSLVHASADTRVLAFGILADDHPVEVLCAASLQRPVDAGQQSRRPHVRVLIESLANFEPQAPQRDVIRDVGIAGGTEQDRVLALERREPIIGHHDPVSPIVVAAPVEILEFETERTVRGRQRLEHLLARRNHFLADAVAGDRRNLVDLHP